MTLRVVAGVVQTRSQSAGTIHAHERLAQDSSPSSY